MIYSLVRSRINKRNNSKITHPQADWELKNHFKNSVEVQFLYSSAWENSKQRNVRMAESAVSFLLSRLETLVQQEVHLIRRVWGDFEYMKSELQRISAFLRVADTMEESDDEIKTWVEQVRDVAYDTEDVLKEFMIHLIHGHEDGFHGFLRKIFCCIKNREIRHQIASEMQRITSKVRDISEGHQRYCYKLNIPGQESGTAAENDTWYYPRGDALLLEEDELVGIEEPKKQLIGWLFHSDDPSPKVISVVGMGGLGKTTLVKKVYDDSRVKMHFQAHAWITVSQSFKIKELLKDMIQELFNELKQPIPQGVETMNVNRLKEEIKELLCQRRYLLVLDDVWSIGAWRAVKYAFPNNNFGSRVMITTRNAELEAISRSHTYRLKPLSPEQSWDLFCMKTFEDCCPQHLEELSHSILQRCEGLPLAIVAISGVLSTKPTSEIHEWDQINRCLGAELEDNGNLKSIERILSLSYDDLPYYLKSCFLYLSIFPEDHLIEPMRLIRLWIAEGFVKVVQGKKPEEVAEGYLNELFARSLIQAAETTCNGKVKTCRIHDLLRQIIISKSRSQNFAVIYKEENVSWPEKVRRLSAHNTLQNVLLDKSFSHLRSLLMFDMVGSLSKSSVYRFLSGGFRLLSVLDLQDAPLEIFPDEVVRQFHLRYLSLRNTRVKKLPKSIGKLRLLETLDLKHTRVTKLPDEILKLQQLRHLLVYRYEIESYAPFHSKFGFRALAGIASLQSLQKLCFVKANKGGGVIVKEIGSLNQLRRLGVLKLRKEDGMLLCSSIEKLSNLRSLSLTSITEDEIIDLQHISSPPQFLQRLYLTGRLEKLPQWMASLHGLVRVFLKWSCLKDDPLETLQHLPNLVHLEFLQVCGGETLCFKAQGFQKLNLLGLDKLEELRTVIVEDGAMPYLEKLIIRRCKLLEKVPIGIELLSNLKVLEFSDMPHESMETIRSRIQGEDHQKTAHIPKVYFTCWINDCWVRYPLEGETENETSVHPAVRYK